MIDKPKKLSNTARALLAFAATPDDHLILPPRLPIAAARQVARSSSCLGGSPTSSMADFRSAS
jgi:hypothetical protein